MLKYDDYIFNDYWLTLRKYMFHTCQKVCDKCLNQRESVSMQSVSGKKTYNESPEEVTLLCKTCLNREMKNSPYKTYWTGVIPLGKPTKGFLDIPFYGSESKTGQTSLF